MTLVDTNVITDILVEDEEWYEWSASQVQHCRSRSVLAVNPIIFAELAPNFRTAEALEETLPVEDYLRLELPYEAAFRAGQAFVEYRRRGGVKRAPLPDFYIGAHAECTGLPLLTRDLTRYKTYFPDIRLIHP